MDYLGPALFGLAAVVIAALVAGLRGRRKRRVPMTSQADWTSGGDGGGGGD